MTGLRGRCDALVLVKRHQKPQLAKGHIHSF
jgi:hypothetical protein